MRKIIDFFNDYFSITRFQRGFRAGHEAGLEDGGILCQSAINRNNEEWKTKLRRIVSNIPLSKGLADGIVIRRDLMNLIEKK